FSLSFLVDPPTAVIDTLSLHERSSDLVDEGEHGRHHRLRGAAGDDQVRLRIGVDSVEGLRPTGDRVPQFPRAPGDGVLVVAPVRSEEHTLNSSHVSISYAVFCLKKKTS